MSELRARKYARTRLALASALKKALEKQALADISVKALCQTAEVSEATFFNYFLKKQNLMAYLARLWLLELGWYAHHTPAEASGLAAIGQLFARNAQSCARHPGLFRELLAWLATDANLDEAGDVSSIEKRLALPNLTGIEEIPIRGIDVWLVPQLEAAIARGEIPSNVLLPTVLISLLAILFGVSLTLLKKDPERIASMYQQQLQLLWSGVRAATKGNY